METVNQSITNQYAKEQSANASLWEQVLANAEFNRYGIISIGFLLIGIIGGIAIGISAYAHVWQISIIAIFTMLSLSLMLAVAPMRYILMSTAVALAIDVLLVIMNALF